MRKKKCAATALFLCGALIVNAQWTQYYTGNSAMPDNTVRCITFSDDSTAWVGTDFGLVKMVNGNLTIYNTSNSGIADNAIRCITIDSIGRKWIGTFLGGFSIYNDTTWSNFSSLTSPLPDDQVKDIRFDAQHTTWLATTGGLVSIDTAGVWKTYAQFTSPLQSSHIARIYVEPVTDIKIVGTVNGGLSLVDDTTITTYTISNSGIADNSLYDIDVDAAGNYWMASPSNGIVVKVNGAGWTNFSPFNSGIHSSSLTCLELDTLEHLWIGSIDSGIIMKNGLVYKSWNANNSPLSDNYVQSLMFAPDGKLWVGTFSAGVFIVDTTALLTSVKINEKTAFDVYPNPTTDFIVIQSRSVDYIYEVTDATGRVMRNGNSSANKTILEVAAFPSGIYFLVIDTGNEKVLRKIIKQ